MTQTERESTKTHRSDPEPINDLEYARQLGSRLRAMREQRSWSLRDVQVASHGRFTGSAVGTYERGERVHLARAARAGVGTAAAPAPAGPTRRRDWFIALSPAALAGVAALLARWTL